MRPQAPLAALLVPPIGSYAADESAAYHANAGVLQHVNPLVGTAGGDPNDNGGMIPSVCPPFGMTRWTPQTRENYISQVPYSHYDTRMHGFQATHQPAIWMGESGQVVLTPGLGEVKPLFQDRGLSYRKADETSTPYVYEVLLNADSGGTFGWTLTEEWASDTMGAACPPCPGGESGVPDTVVEGAGGRVRRSLPTDEFAVLRLRDDVNMAANSSDAGSDASDGGVYEHGIRVAMTASSHVGYLRFDFEESPDCTDKPQQPHVAVQVTRLNWTGTVEVDASRREISGSNTQRQDYKLGPDTAESFRGFFVSRFSEPFESYGVTQGGRVKEGGKKLEGKNIGAFVSFDDSVKRVEVRTGVSFVSVDQARKNLDLEAPDGTTFESTLEDTKSAWLEKLGRITIDGFNKTGAEHDARDIFYTALFHALQYPNDFSEPTESVSGGKRTFYSGYTDSVHEAEDSYYQSWSIWDTYRAEHSLLTLFAPERVDSMMRTLLQIYDWSGRLPMWANMIETNIMIATNADVVLANALARGFKDFDVDKAWAAVHKDAYEPPERDTELLYYDREPNTPYEVRAGLTSYMQHGWVDNDRWAESASRSLDYAFDDYAAAVVASHAGDKDAAKELLDRSGNYAHLWNKTSEFMQARNSNGTFADPTWGWTEGDMWVYTFDVMHDVGGLAALFRGGKKGMKAKLDEHFHGGHNMHSNEPSHHVPYLYSALGYTSDTADKVRSIAWENYNATANGLSGNEDLGQMSAWYVFSALGFYPVDPASDEFVVGTPFFDEVRIQLPAGPATGGGPSAERTLTILAPGAAGAKHYVKSLRVDGKEVERPQLSHQQLVTADKIEFEMSEEPTTWGQEGTV